MSNYACDGCQIQILPQHPRFHCQTCPDYDSCANCNTVQHMTGSHTREHIIGLIRQSGIIAVQHDGNHQPAQYPQQPQAYTSTTQPNGWTPLYNPDNTPSQVFVTILQQFFTCLDPYRTGCVSPEAYSSFMEAQGYAPNLNIWRHAYATAYGNKESAADAALKSVYEILSIEHILQQGQRAAPPPRPQAKRGFLSNLLSGSMSDSFASALSGPASPMPLLTLRGFIDGTSLEILTDPSIGWSYINRALQYYQIPIWREKENLPRAMIPMITPPAVQKTIDQIQQTALNRANNQLETARMNAEISKRANEIAVGILTPSVDRYGNRY